MKLAGTSIAALWLVGIGPVLAASPSASDAAPAAEAAAAGGEAKTLDAVVVTARKKSEPLQKVPGSVVAMDATQQRELGIDNLADVATHVPGLEQLDLAISSRLSLRGVNSGDNNAFEQSVGVYVDGLYRGRMNQQHIGLFDLQRIEVLKGPQVTLYGNSSVGGAISVITRKPSFTAGGEVHARYEFEYDEARIEAGFDVLVNERLALRISGKWRDQREGNSFNAYSGDTEPTFAESAVRLGALWQPTDAWTVSLRHEQGRYDRDGHVFDVYKHVDGQGNPWPGSTFTGIDDGELNVGNGDPFKYQTSFLKTDMDETLLEVEYETERFSVTSLTGHSRYDFQQSLDVDISPYTLVNVYQDERYRQFSQELRLAGSAGDRVDYLAGLYYQDDAFRNDYLSDFNLPLLLASAFGVSPDVTGQLIDPFSRHILLDQDTRQWAVFGSVDWQVSERLAASAGFRWLAIDKDGRQAVRSASIDHVDGVGDLVDVRWLNPALAALLLGNPDYLADPTHYVLVLGDGTTIDPVLVPQYALGYNIVSAGNGVLHEFDGLSRRERHPMFNASLAWQWSDDLLLYANWANGAKAGGFDFNYEKGDRAEVEYAPEKADVFEVGFKKDWRNARLNLAVFYGRYSDLQVSVYDGGIGFVVGNAASSISKGIDVEFEWNLDEHWRTFGQVEYLDFRYDDFRTANCSTTERLNGSGPICDWSGDRTPFVPELEGSLALEHAWQGASGWTLAQQLRWTYKGDHATASDNEIQTRQDAYSLFDYRAEFTPAGKAWSVALIGRNLTDERYNVFTSVIPLAPGGAFANVRSKGREVALEWNLKF
jgi:outer membrane receptor protein involved in Fe transport